MASNLRQRAVVSSFICTSPESATGLTFALFKRSQDVSTYPGKWAVCSGSIDSTDASPYFAARREILEETTLDSNDINLLRRGKPFSLIDEKLKTEWTIHPFAWQLTSSAKSIKFDWEHTEYHFVKPEDLGNYDHVPQLEIGMKRVLVSPETERALKVLRDDHESGANALAAKALELLLGFVKGEEMAKLSTDEEFWRELRMRAWHLVKNGRPSMSSAIESEIGRVLRFINAGVKCERQDDDLLERVKKFVEVGVEDRIKRQPERLLGIAEHFVKFIEKNDAFHKTKEDPKCLHIVTLSSSGTTKECLQHLIKHAVKSDVQLNLTVLESRPKFEGVAFVNSILEQYSQDTTAFEKIHIDIVSDASIASIFNSPNDSYYLLLGADKVLPNGDVSNKIGSRTAAAVARAADMGCKIVAVFDLSKVGFASEEHETEYNSQEEVMDAWPLEETKKLKRHQKNGVKVGVKNAYFEWVPAEYIDVYITDHSLIGKDDIERVAVNQREAEESIFGDL